jgi:hypothetical protein
MVSSELSAEKGQSEGTCDGSPFLKEYLLPFCSTSTLSFGNFDKVSACTITENKMEHMLLIA